ncbi:E3 ubiquitin-protein ligase CHFR [Linum grandiflorum]
MDHHSTPASSGGGRRRGTRTPNSTGRGSWATLSPSPTPSHHHQVGGEGNYVDESSSRMGRLSLGRGGISPQFSPASFHKESDHQLQTPPTKFDEKATKASVSDPEQAAVEPLKKLGFDICLQPKPGALVTLKPSLHATNREKRNMQRNMEVGLNGDVLRPGMVLLKHYLSLDTQVKIVNQCRQLGVGSAGFYQPEFRSGDKMHLKMMCLGSSWEPDVDKYVETRTVDGAKPPNIPRDFIPLVMDAIKDSQALIARTSKPASVGNDVLPSMSPSICVVNFYTSNGRLGLHQDKAESPESLRKGLPVVSFSIGDSAEFQYAERRDDVAGKVLLESGDVLIFGGRYPEYRCDRFLLSVGLLQEAFFSQFPFFKNPQNTLTQSIIHFLVFFDDSPDFGGGEETGFEFVPMPDPEPSKRKLQINIDADNAKCSICLSIWHDVVTVAPCLHNFCNGCFSEWLKRSQEKHSKVLCPQCRGVAQFVGKNHLLQDIKEEIVKSDSSLKRSDEEIAQLDSYALIKTCMVIEAGRKRKRNGPRMGSDSVDEDLSAYLDPIDPHYAMYLDTIDQLTPMDELTPCVQCGREYNGFRCNGSTIHLECHACGGGMPLRADSAAPQHCLGCDRPFCGAYWQSQGFTGYGFIVPCGPDVLKPITESCIRQMGRTIPDVISEWIGKLNNGDIGIPLS